MSRTEGTYVNPTRYNVATEFVTALSAGQTGDATTTKTSPFSAASSDPPSSFYYTLYIPDNAAEVVLMPDHDIYVSDLTTFAGYTKCIANNAYPFGCGGMDALYVVAASGNARVYYHFHLIG